MYLCGAALFISILVPIASRGAAENSTASYVAGLKFVEAWDLGQAVPIAQALMESDPSNPANRYLMAKVLYFSGEYSAARDTLAPAAKELEGDPHAGFLREMIGRTIKATERLTAHHEEGLEILLDEEKDSILIPYIKDAMDKAFRAIEKRLGFRPQRPLRIEVYPDSESFHLASSLTKRDIEVSGAVGIAKFNKIMVISPRVLARGYSWLDTLSHEYLHYVIVMLSGNRAPIWLHEGMAKYYEGTWRSDGRFKLEPVPRTLLARALENDALITFEEMYPSLVKLETTEEVQLAYAEAATAIQFITGFGGDGIVRDILRRMEDEPSSEPLRVIEASLGITGGEFTRRWKHYLKELDLKPLEGLDLPGHRVKGAFFSTETLDLKEIKSEISRNNIRLGDMLKLRGRISAAILEYRRALNNSPHSSVILNRLGSALAKAGSVDEGVEKLQRAAELYPGFGPSYKNLAEIFRTLGEHSLAGDYYLKAIRINPFDPVIHEGLMASLSALGRTEEAQRERAILIELLTPEEDNRGNRKPRTGDTDE